jgi:enoyl-CoA hydratase/carnithine racemase
MPVVELRKEGHVFILTMNAGENRLNPPVVSGFNTALDEVERSTGPAALVTVGGEAKFYSNGLDLDWLLGEGQGDAGTFIETLLRLMGRLVGFPVPTVAAINGHVFAAGAMLALAHDFRVMRADRGFFCLPEVDIKFPLAPGMVALIKNRLSAAAFRDTVLTGERVGGEEAVRRGIVDEAAMADEVLPRAVARAGALAEKDRAIYGRLKRAMYADVLGALEAAALP